MHRRGLQRDYPYFFNYIILQVVTFSFLFPAYFFSYTIYFYGYWVSIALSSLVSFAVLQEIFKDAFRPYEALQDLSVILFRWSALIVLLVAGMWAITTTHSSQFEAVTNTIFLIERSVRLMQCGLVFFLLLFSEYLGISRRHYLFGVAVGFGVYASLNMLVATGMAHPSIVPVMVMRWINSASYDLAVFIWLGYALLSEPSRRGKQLMRAKDLDNALQDALLTGGDDSLLDTMDRKVEKLLYPKEKAEISVASAHRS